MINGWKTISSSLTLLSCNTWLHMPWVCSPVFLIFHLPTCLLTFLLTYFPTIMIFSAISTLRLPLVSKSDMLYPDQRTIPCSPRCFSRRIPSCVCLLSTLLCLLAYMSAFSSPSLVYCLFVLSLTSLPPLLSNFPFPCLFHLHSRLPSVLTSPIFHFPIHLHICLSHI